MISTMDIYYRIDTAIVPQNFWGIDIVAKKKLIDTELKNYIISKIQEIRGTIGLIGETNPELSVGELLEILAGLIPKEQHFDTLRHFTHYILQVAGNLQSWSISWWQEDEEDLILTPFIEFNEEDLWKDLKTHNDTDYVQIFNFVYHIFNNVFMIKKEQKKLERILPENEE